MRDTLWMENDMVWGGKLWGLSSARFKLEDQFFRPNLRIKTTNQGIFISSNISSIPDTKRVTTMKEIDSMTRGVVPERR